MKRNLPDFIESYLQYTDNHESTRKIQLWTILSVMAGAIERKVWIDRGHWNLYPNLYVFIIGKSGIIKKSTSTAIGVNLLKEVEGINFMSERLTAASLVQQMAISHNKFLVTGEEVNQSSVYCYASELAVLMGEVYGSITELLTTFYDCQPSDPSKPWVYKAKHEDAQQIYGPCLNILGASTKSWLKKCIPKSEHEGGFTSRCVFVVENNPPKKLIAWPVITSEQRQLRQLLLEDLTIINQLTGKLTVSPETIKLFTTWYEHHNHNVIPKNKDPRFFGYLARKGEFLLKIGMLRSISLSNDLIMTPDHFHWAGKEIEGIERDMMTAFSKSDLGEADAEKIYTYIKQKGKVAVKDIQDEFGLAKGKQGKMLDHLAEKERIEHFLEDGILYFRIKTTPKY